MITRAELRSPLNVAQQGRGRSRRGWTYTRAGVWTIRLVTLGVLLLIWQIGAQGVSRALLVPPTDVAAAVWRLTVDEPVLVQEAVRTARSFAIGFAAAVTIGILIGLAMGRARRLEEVLDPWVFFLYAIPSIAMIPVFVIWFGIGDVLKIMLVFIASVFPVIINTAAGVKNVDKELVDTARAYCANERQIMRSVILPASVPFIFAGTRVALSQALVGIIGAEILSVITGLGGLIITFANDFQTANMFAPIVVIIFIALVLSDIMRRLQARVSRWQVQPSNDS